MVLTAFDKLVPLCLLWLACQCNARRYAKRHNSSYRSNQMLPINRATHRKESEARIGGRMSTASLDLLRVSLFAHAQGPLGSTSIQNGHRVQINDAHTKMTKPPRSTNYKMADSDVAVSNKEMAPVARLFAWRNSVKAYGDAATACGYVLRNLENGTAWQTLGRLLHGKGRYEASRICLARAADLDPSDFQSRIDLGNVLRAMGRFSESMASLQEAFELSGDMDQSLCYFGNPLAASPTTAGLDSQSLPGCRPASPGSKIQVIQLASSDECRWVIQEAETLAASRGGWKAPPPRFAPAGTVADRVRAPHMLVAESPKILSWFNGKLESLVWPALRYQFGEEVVASMWLYDAFLLKFDKAPSRSGLGIHIDDDGLSISLNLQLSSKTDFEGGGVFFEDNGNGHAETVKPDQGEMVSHLGGLPHASVPTTGGIRYVLVAFIRSKSLIEAPPSYLRLSG